MLDNLETLLELHRQGTMAKTSTVLRVSQSAVSKRISALEMHYGVPLVLKKGRNVVLSDDALKLVKKIEPLLSEVREAIYDRKKTDERRVVFGVSESVLSSWGAAKIEKISKKLKIRSEYHSHRSPVVIEKVESGVYDLGLCSGKVSNPRSIVTESLISEELVLVTQRPDFLKRTKDLDIIGIEKSSATWKAIQHEVHRRKLNPTCQLESFFSIGQLAKVGYGVGLVPIGVAEALGFRKSCIVSLKPKLFRPIQIVYKKSKLQSAHFEDFVSELLKLTGIK